MLIRKEVAAGAAGSHLGHMQGVKIGMKSTLEDGRAEKLQETRLWSHHGAAGVSLS